MSEIKVRENWVDIVKGFAILCVIMGHNKIPSGMSNFIYSFHMPVFFLLSGYFLKPRPMKEVLVKRGRQLLFPYIITSLFIVLSDLLHNISKIHSKKDVAVRVMQWMWAAFYGSGITYKEPVYIKHIGALWFLLALWFATLIVSYALNQKDEWKGILFVLIMAAVGYTTGKIFWLPFSVQAGMVAAIYVYCGTVARRYDLIRKVQQNPICFATALFTWGGYLWIGGGQLYMVRNYYQYGGVDFLCSLCACAVLCVVGRVLDAHSKYVKKLFCWLGQNSLTILCLHIVELNTFRWNEVSFLTAYWPRFWAKTLYCSAGVIVVNAIKIYIQRKKKPFSPLLSEKIREESGQGLQWLDLAMGTVILLMILGHLPIDEKLRTIIFSFHMPFFFIISGYMFRENIPIPVLVKKKIKGLILPYLGVELCAWLIRVWKAEFYVQVSVQRAVEATLKEGKAALLGMSYSSTIFQNVSSVGPIWFVVCLFWSILLFAVIHKAMAGRSEILEFAIACVCCVAGIYIGENIAFLPYSFDVSLVGVLFIYIGFWVKKEALLDKLITWKSITLLAIVWVIGIYLGNIELAVRSYPYFPVCIVAAVAGSLFVMKAAQKLYCKSMLCDFLCFFGVNSMIVLGIHGLELSFVGWNVILDGYAAMDRWVIKIILIGAALLLARLCANITSAFKCCRGR